MEENKFSAIVFVALTAIATTSLYISASSSTKQDDDGRTIMGGDDEIENGQKHNPEGTKARDGDSTLPNLRERKIMEPDKVIVTPFPWEIVPSHDSSTKSRPENNHHEMPNRFHETSSLPKSQLDFLASMTFANGGLRAPSCPCCI